MQVDSTYSDVKYSVRDQTYMTVDAHTLKAADDVVVCILRYLSTKVSPLEPLKI